MLRVSPPAASFGIRVIEGVTADASTADAGMLRSVLAESAVVCLRFDHALSDDEFAAVASLFGPIKDPVGRVKGGGELRYSRKRQVIDAGFVMTEAVRAERGDLNFGGLDSERPGLFETYHCDDTYTEAPALATVLHARQLPPSGGGPTHFIDMRAVYAALQPDRRATLDPLKVVYAYNNEGAFPSRVSASGAADVLVDAVHPLVRTHPLAGTKALFIDLDRAKHVEGMPLQEGRLLLQALQDEAEATAPTCHHDWHAHDVLAWDNASVQHKAQGNFNVGEPRRFWRYMIAGPPPR